MGVSEMGVQFFGCQGFSVIRRGKKKNKHYRLYILRMWNGGLSVFNYSFFRGNYISNTEKGDSDIYAE